MSIHIHQGKSKTIRMCSETFGSIQDQQEFLKSTRTQADTPKSPGATQYYKVSLRIIIVRYGSQRAVKMYLRPPFYTQEQVALFKMAICCPGSSRSPRITRVNSRAQKSSQGNQSVVWNTKVY